MQEWFSQFMASQPLIQILDILLVWYLIYKLLIYARGTQMMNLLKGVAIFIAAKFVSATIGLQTIDWLLGQVLAWGVIAAIVLFQPELRRALEILGRNFLRNKRSTRNPSVQLIKDLETSLLYLSKRKIGALIVIEAEDELTEFVETGIPIDSHISNQLLINIFIPNTPLHDGAVVIKDYRVSAASCYLPLSESSAIPKELGTRHRAAIGLGEVSDALTLIVSEETGDISFVKEDTMHRGVTKEELPDLLERYLLNDEEPEEDKDFMSQIREFFTGNFKTRGDQNEK